MICVFVYLITFIFVFSEHVPHVSHVNDVSILWESSIVDCSSDIVGPFILCCDRLCSKFHARSPGHRTDIELYSNCNSIFSIKHGETFSLTIDKPFKTRSSIVVPIDLSDVCIEYKPTDVDLNSNKKFSIIAFFKKFYSEQTIFCWSLLGGLGGFILLHLLEQVLDYIKMHKSSVNSEVHLRNSIQNDRPNYYRKYLGERPLLRSN